jgi:hypothetical protein
MQRRGCEAISHNRRQLTRIETDGEALKRVAGSDLRLPPFVDVAADARMLNPPSLCALGLETIQTSVIDGLERQALLKPLDR